MNNLAKFVWQVGYKYRTCHAKWKLLSPSAMPATPTAAATTASNGELSAPPELAQCRKRRAYHVKWRSMSQSAMSATQNGGLRHQAQRHQVVWGVWSV
jgi:hypothetical protein